MRSQSATIEFVSFSTRGLPSTARGDALCNLKARGILTVEPLRDRVPRATIRKRFLPGADILSGTIGGLRQFGTQHGGDNVFLAVNVDGESTACERGREINLRSGDALLFSGADGECTINRPAPVRIAAMRIPHRALAPLVANLSDAAMRLIPKETASLRLLATYLRAIDMGHALDSPGLCPAVVTHIHDLVALSVGAARDFQEVAEERSVRAARLRTIEADIAANVGDCELNVSRRRCASRRDPPLCPEALRGRGDDLFRVRTGPSPLRRAPAAEGPAPRDRPIASVAFDCGFADLSYFNRTFRRRYNATPTEVRSGAGLR